MKKPSKNYPIYVTQKLTELQQATPENLPSKQRYSMTRKPIVSHFYQVIEHLSRTLKKEDQVRFVLTGDSLPSCEATE